MKIVKYLFYSFFLVVLFHFGAIEVSAADSASIKLSPSSTKVVEGDTVKITITVSANTKFESVDFDIKYDTSYLTFKSSNMNGNTRVSYYNADGAKSKTWTITFKAKKSGTTKVSVANASIYNIKDKEISSVTKNTSNITIQTQAQANAEKSSVNTLKSLSIEGYPISPKFDKNTTSYMVTVPNDVTSVNVKASKTDSKAMISGAGKVKVSEGSNTISVVVTAENGSKKTYKINVIVEELSPLLVTIDGVEYSVIRKYNKLKCPDNFQVSKSNIENTDIPICNHELTKTNLVGVTDSNGNQILYIYENNTYILYQEYEATNTTLILREPSKEESGNLKPRDFKLGDLNITAYEHPTEEFPLIYGLNLNTGEYRWYTYDEEENTLQRYIPRKDGEVVIVKEETVKKSDELLILIAVLGGSLFLVILFVIILYSKYRRLNKEKNE